MKNQSVIALRLCVAFGAAMLFGCGASSSSVSSVKIGAIYSSSGDQESLDQASLEGAQLAVEQLNAKGGVLGRPVRLEVRDGGSSMERVAEVAQTLFGADQLDIVIGLSDTGLANPVAELSQAEGKIFVTSGATGPDLVSEAPDSTFLACFSDEAQARAIADYAVSKLRLRSVGVAYDAGSEYAKVLVAAFQQRFRSQGGMISFQSPFSAGDIGVERLISEIGEEQPQALFLAAQPNEVSSVLSALRKSGVRIPILGGDSYDSPRISSLPPSITEKVFFSTHVLLTGNPMSPVMRDFVALYGARYGTPPQSGFAALGYDTVNLVAQAVSRAGSTSPDPVRGALEATSDFQGVTGTMSFGRGLHIPKKDVTIVTFIDGQPRVAAVTRP